MTDNPFSALQGITEKKAQTLVEAGITSIPRLAMAKVSDLTSLDGIQEATALKLIGLAQEATGIGAPRRANDVYRAWKKDSRFLASGSKAIDTLLGGGFRGGFTYEIAGKNGHSKSQLICQLLTNAICPVSVGGWEGTALLIDTENTGDPLSERIHDFVLGNGVPDDEADQVMSRLDIIACPNSESQMNVVKRLLDQNKRYDLVAVDGLMTKFRAEFIGRGVLAERQGLLSDHQDDLNVYASLHRCLVIYTNQVMDNPEMYGGTLAIGGNVVGHASKYRLTVKKAKENKRILRLDKAPNLPEGEAVFLLTSEGITDA